MEYLRHFELSEDPFRNDHLDRFVSEIPSQVEALGRLDRGVRQGRGLVVLVGSAGSGKTAVARRLYEELEEEVFEASMTVLLRSSVDAEWLLSRFARQLGVDEPAEQREALVEQIYERLAIVREDGRHSVLIVDDADALATPDTLAELCALVKLEYEERRMLTVVLVGSEALDRVLRANPGLVHHVETRVEMKPLPSDEATAYLEHRLGVAGGAGELLLPGAAAALQELAQGAPGRMNILADNALFEAFSAGRSQVTRSDVERAHAELGWATAAPVVSPTEEAGAYRQARRPGRSSPSARGVASAPASDGGGNLDSELDAVFAPAAAAPQASTLNVAAATRLMDFDNSQSGMSALSERPAPAPTEIQLGPADVLEAEAPAKEEGEDEVDDLFMELIND